MQCAAQKNYRVGNKEEQLGKKRGRREKHNIREALLLLPDTPLCEIHSAAG
jgi:hypothetical protein